MDFKDIQQICDYVYVGLSFKEALLLCGVPESELPAIAKDVNLKRVVEYARTKAKADLLTQAHKVVNGERASMGSIQILKHILAARFGFSENRYELKQKHKQHLDNVRMKEAALKQWADYQTAKMIQDGTTAQLEEWAKP